MATAWSDVATNVVIILLPLGCVGSSGHPCKMMAYASSDLGAQDAILEKDWRVQCVPSGGFVSRQQAVESFKLTNTKDCRLWHCKARRLLSSIWW